MAGSPEQNVCETLAGQGFTVRLRGFSAIDRYLGWDSLPFVFVETDAPLSALARHFEGLRFPGAALADAAVEYGGRDYLFRCPDSGPDSDTVEAPAFQLLRFTQDWKTKRFYDPQGFYPLFRRLRGQSTGQDKRGNSTLPDPPPWWEGFEKARDWPQAAMEGALILARYSFSALPDADMPEKLQREIKKIALDLGGLPDAPPPSAEEQRILLLGLLDSPHPELGFEFLKSALFVEEHWPELAILDDVDHSKEFHPEGNVWKHTMETFRYRKAAKTAGNKTFAGYDLRLSLSLLLHDSGKPLAESSGNHRFQAHAELGAHEARRFLDRLGFNPALVNDVAWLVKNHMLPAAMPRLPLIRTQEIMESPLFPTLMELYRCDESSSFKGLDGYYESSRAYQAYLKHRRNPYRNADGKKMGKKDLG